MKRILCGLLGFAVALPATAIIRRHDRDDARYLAAAAPYDYVVDLNLPGGAGTLIAPRWVVTAAHAAKLMKSSHVVKIAGKPYEVAKCVIFPDGGEGKDDIALLKLATAAADVKPVPIYEGTQEDHEPGIVTFVGQGFSGDGLSGPTVRDGKRRAATSRHTAMDK